MSVGKLSGLLGTQTYQRAVKFGTFRGEQTPKNAAVLDPVQGISPVYNTQKRATFQADFTQDKIDVDLLLCDTISKSRFVWECRPKWVVNTI